MQRIANQLLDVFTDTKRVTKSHIPALNAPARIDIPNEQTTNTLTNESITCQKRGRPIGLKDKNPRKKIEQNKEVDTSIVFKTLEEVMT